MQKQPDFALDDQITASGSNPASPDAVVSDPGLNGITNAADNEEVYNNFFTYVG